MQSGIEDTEQLLSAEEAKADTDQSELVDGRRDSLAELKIDSVAEDANQLDPGSDIAVWESSDTADAALQESHNIQLAAEAAMEAIEEVEKVIQDEMFPEQETPQEFSAADRDAQAVAESAPEANGSSEEGMTASTASEQIKLETQPEEDSSQVASSSATEGSVQEPVASASNILTSRQEEATSSLTGEGQVKPSEAPRRRRKRVRRKPREIGRTRLERAYRTSRPERTSVGEPAQAGEGRIGETTQAETSTSDAKVRMQFKAHQWGTALNLHQFCWSASSCILNFSLLVTRLHTSYKFSNSELVVGLHPIHSLKMPRYVESIVPLSERGI